MTKERRTGKESLSVKSRSKETAKKDIENKLNDRN